MPVQSFCFMWYVLILWVLHWRLIAYLIDVISSLLTIAMFGFCETEFLCILCVRFKCFSSHLSPVSYHPSPSSSRLIAFWLMLLVCSLCDTKWILSYLFLSYTFIALNIDFYWHMWTSFMADIINFGLKSFWNEPVKRRSCMLRTWIWTGE